MSLRKTRHRGIAALSTLLAALLWAPYGWSWGPLAHRVTARMAESRLTPRALAAVRDLLGPGQRLEDAAVWADDQREVPGSETWHYVNVPVSQARYDAKFCPSKGCVVSKIEEFRLVLADPKAPKPAKRRALTFLVHLIGDLHQPLHVGDNGDRGGNLLQVLFFGEGSNLHRVWDSQIMERHTDNKQVWLWDMTYMAKPRMVEEWSKGTPADWATESLAIAKEAYRIPGRQTLIRRGAKLGGDYVAFALPVIQRQLAKAAVRIAFVLNGVFL